MSMAPFGRRTFTHLSRITLAAAAYSATDSPRARIAISRPPICAGVAVPSNNASNAASACARDSGPSEAA
jgi:hypothetical protein